MYRRCRCLNRKRLLFRRCPYRADPDSVLSDSCRKHHLFCPRRLGPSPVDPDWIPMDSCPATQIEY